MNIFDNLMSAFVVGGLICVIGQILLDKTQMQSARILVLFVCVGCVLGAIGLYEPLVKFAGAGATVPLTGFGYNLAKGVMSEIDSVGALGILTGGMKSAAGGIAGAIIFSWATALVFEPKGK